MYAAGGAHPYLRHCRRALDAVHAGRLVAVTDTEVHQEILYRYLQQRRPQEAVRVSELLETAIPTTLPVTLTDVRRARQLAGRYPALPARDLIHLAVMLNNEIRAVVT